jgi:hypothetical protein
LWKKPTKVERLHNEIMTLCRTEAAFGGDRSEDWGSILVDNVTGEVHIEGSLRQGDEGDMEIDNDQDPGNETETRACRITISEQRQHAKQPTQAQMDARARVERSKVCAAELQVFLSTMTRGERHSYESVKERLEERRQCRIAKRWAQRNSLRVQSQGSKNTARRETQRERLRLADQTMDAELVEQFGLLSCGEGVALGRA